ncbi:hypothetical protein GCM10009546_59270 [Actinomadura livida]|uniref:Uncharacterized protein n=1 Tax=Actinomadura livida TaxID=79909 RepID=A0ABN1FEA2_9ACTN|nr:hypothetical protein GCM10010208_61150 [Actinomadura livida]
MRPTVTVEPSHRWNGPTRATPSSPEPRKAPSGTYFRVFCTAGVNGHVANVDAVSAIIMTDTAKKEGSGQNGIVHFRRRPHGRPAEWISGARMRMVCPRCPPPNKGTGRAAP